MPTERDASETDFSGSDYPRLWIFVRLTIAVTVIILVGSSLATGWELDGGRDWDYFQADLLSARQSILDHGEWPLWMPHRSGGHDGFADPQSSWFSPFGLLVLIFDFPLGARLFLIGCGCFGALGAIQLGKEFGLSTWACVLFSVIMYLSMPMGLYAAGGIPNFSLGWAILPWLVLLVERGTPWSSVGGGLILSISLYSGDPNHFVWHSVFLALLGTGLSVLRQTWKPIVAVLMTGVSTAIFAMPKMLPMWLMLRDQPRLVDISGPGGNTLGMTYHAFLHLFPPFLERPHGEFVCLLRSGELVSSNFIHPRLVSQIVPGTQGDWVNIGCYVGWLTVLLAVVGTVTCLLSFVRVDANTNPLPRAQTDTTHSLRTRVFAFLKRPNMSFVLALVVASLIFYWLSLGTNVTPSLWSLLHRLPVFSSMKSPIRLLVYLLLPVALLASIGLDGVMSLTRRKMDQSIAKGFAIALIALIGFDVHLPTRHLYRVAFCETPFILPTRSPDCFQQKWDGRDHSSTLYASPVTPAVRADKGLVNGYTIFNADTNVVACSSDAYQSEVDTIGDASATVEEFEFTARSIRFSVQADRSTELVVNQNWYRGWQVVEPAQAQVSATDDGRIAVTVPAGQHRVWLKYTPPGMYLGICVFLLAFPVWIGGIAWRGHSSRVISSRV